MSGFAKIGGHPIHPMLIVFPIGLWIFSFLCDLIFIFGWGTAIWNDMAFYTMAGGIVGALLAAVPGLIDFFAISDRMVGKIATLHMVINLAVVALFALNLWVRMLSVPGSALPVVLSAVAIVLLGVAGWLGGEMVFVHGVGMEDRRDAGPKDVRRVA